MQVKSIAEMGAYVHLLEYNNIEGMILLSELSRRRIRSITKLIKVPPIARFAVSSGPQTASKASAMLCCRLEDKSQSWCCVSTRAKVTLTCQKGLAHKPLPPQTSFASSAE
jgi:hypothetical protein